ncbi:MAG: SpoIIE family protein phosphatase [Cyanothece sp. SIO2G6]|nr:SpoIIE family protein phosphatase [Cyanothece sp. SIO2G6]
MALSEMRWSKICWSKIRLSTLLIISFCTQLGLTVGLVGYFSLRSGQQAVEEVSHKLSTEVTRRIQERLALHLDLPHLVNQFNANALTANIVSLDDLEAFQTLLWRQVQSHEAINNTYIGTPTGDFFGVERNVEDDGFSYLLAGPSTASPFWLAETESSPLPENLVKRLPNFDPRVRPWYQAAIAQNGPVWSEVYQDFSSGKLMITASQPVQDELGNVVGVLGSDFIFSENINTFLQSLQIGKSGEAFILDQQGYLIATSTDIPTVAQLTPEEREEQVPTHQLTQGIDSAQPLIREASRYVAAFNQGNLLHINDIQQLNFSLDQTPYYLQATPLKDDRGIDWLILVVIPEDDFLGPLQRSTQFILLLCGAALVISSGIALLITRKINYLLSKIIQATQKMIAGNLKQRVQEQGILETNALAISFNQMAEQLQNSFAALSENEERMRSVIDNVPGIIYRCRNDEHWTMEFMSDSIEEMVGYPVLDFLNNHTRSFASIIHPGDRNHISATIQIALTNKTPFQIEYRLNHQNGTTHWVLERGQGTFDCHGNLLHLDGAIFDITAQKQAEDTIQEKEKTIHAIVNAIPDLLIRTTIDGFELDALGNSKFFPERTSFEWTDSRDQKQRVEDFLPPDLAQQRMDVVRTVIATDQIQQYEQYLQRPDKSPRYEEVRVAPINSDEALVIIRDITETKEMEEALQELSAASRIQANMLPDYQQVCDSISQLDLVATMTPAQNVGGDFFDVFALDHRYLCITVGDVSGKGIPAALFMVRAMTLLRMAVDTGMPLNISTAKVNQFLCVNNLECMFVTLFVGLLDVYTGELRYVNCGHNPPFLGRNGKAFEELDPPQGILMGVFEGAEYEMGTLLLNQDDTLILYTDGVTEAESINHDFFSTARTIEVLNSLGDRTQIQTLVSTLQDRIDQFSKGMPQSDDITILALRYLGNEAMEPEKYEEIELEWLVQNIKADASQKL